jgi:hypothetical protein
LPNSCKHDAAKIDDIDAIRGELQNTQDSGAFFLPLFFFPLLELVTSERLAHGRGPECRTGGLDITTRWLNVINFVFTPKRPYLSCG